MNRSRDVRSWHRLVLLLGGALIFPAAATFVPQSAGAESATPSVRFDVASFGPGPLEWRASRNAALREVRTGSGVVGHLQPRRSKGAKTIRMTSRSSSTVIPQAGSTVRFTAKVSTSQQRAKIAVRVYEVSGGRAIARRTVVVRPTSSRWHDVAITLRTSRPGSRLRLYSYLQGVTRRHFMRLGSINAEVAPPTADPAAPATPPTQCDAIDYSDPAQGRLSFADEFDGTSLDPATWRTRDKTFLNHDQAYIKKENVTVHDGSLDIMGQRMPQSEWKTNASSLYPETKTRAYSTGYVDTIDSAGFGNAAADRFSQKYGSFEIRALLPSTSSMSRGIWPAFWLRGDHSKGELDVMESYGAPTIRSTDPSSTYEWNSWADTSQTTSKDHAHGTAHPGYDNEPVWQAWHRYGVHWSPTCLRYTYDGTTVGTVPLSSKSYLTGEPFDDTFHIRLNMQIGSKYWGWPDPEFTRSEFHYLVDYVRVYQGYGN
jgi:beta-glucanase (GH16 family)